MATPLRADAKAPRLLLAASLSLTLSAGDVLMSLLARPSDLASPLDVLPPLGGGLLLFALLFLLLDRLPRLLAGRARRIEQGPAMIAAAAFLVSAFFLWTFAMLGRKAFTPVDLVPALIAALLSTGAALASYVAARHLRHSRRTVRAAFVGSVVVPVAALVALAAVWLQIYLIPEFLSWWTLAVTVLVAALLLVVTRGAIALSSPRRVTRGLVAAWCLFVAAAGVSAGRAAVHAGVTSLASPGIVKVPHVILITVDTLRPDVLGCYGGPATPGIDRLARDGLLFERAYSSAPWTLPAIASLMTGVSPMVHLAQNLDSRLPGALPTLAEYFQAAGYRTAAIGRNPTLLPYFNLSQGFDEYDFFPRPGYGTSLGAAAFETALAAAGPSDISTAGITARAARWMRAHENEPFFLWIHYFDPHTPYDPPAKYLPPGTPDPEVGTRFGRADEIRSGFFVPTMEGRRWIRKLYEGEVAYVDESVGRLFDEMRELDLYEGALIALTSDHGEEFWEHGGFEHGHTLNDEVIRVPLIVKGPAGAARGRFPSAIPVRGLMPGLLDLCGIAYDWEGHTVRSLGPLLQGAAGRYAEQPVVSTSTLYYEDRFAVVFGGVKYVRSLVTGREDIFDLAHDPGETSPVASADTLRLAEGRRIFQDRKSRTTALRQRYGISRRERAQVEVEAAEELRSLGYIR